MSDYDWKDKIFPTIDFEQASIWEAWQGVEIILPSSRNIDSRNKAVAIAINKFGGKDGLKRQNKKRGEVAMMTHSLGFPDDNGHMTYVTRDIYHPIVSGESSHESDNRALFEALQKIKETVLREKKN